jgi:rRNA maturation endonuclease Nob1
MTDRKKCVWTEELYDREWEYMPGCQENVAAEPPSNAKFCPLCGGRLVRFYVVPTLDPDEEKRE